MRTSWPVNWSRHSPASQTVARRNARIAAEACRRRRVEREIVEAFLLSETGPTPLPLAP